MRTYFATLLIVFVASGVSADDKFEPSHKEAAADFLLLSGAEQSAMVAASSMTDVMLQQNPTLAPYQDVILSWAAKTMTWDNMKARMIDLYVEAFTEKELRELSAFYSTPLGTKMLNVAPGLMQQSSQISADLATENQAELEAMIEARAAELSQ